MLLGNYVFNTDQTVAVGNDQDVLTYDNASGEIRLQAGGGGTGDILRDGTLPMTGDFNVADNSIVTTSNNDLALNPDGTGAVAHTAPFTQYDNGTFSAVDDAIAKTWVLRTQTTDGTQTRLYVNGSSTQIDLAEAAGVPDGMGMTFSGIIVAAQTNAFEDAAFKIEGWARCVAGTVQVQGVTSTPIYRSTNADTGQGDWSVTATNESPTFLSIRVTGAASDNINWVAKIDTVQTIGELF